MATELTPGRWRGLKTTSDNGIFSILAFDQRGSYRKMLPEGTDYDTAVEIKTEVVVSLTQVASAVLLDPEYSLTAAMQLPGRAGFMLSLEESGYTGDGTYRQIKFYPDWNVAKIKRMGASAVKLLAYYHPHSGELAESVEQVIRDVAQDCHRHDLPLFLEPLSYSLNAAVSKESAEFAAQRPQIVRDTAERLSRTGADVLKLEFPCDAAYDQDEAHWRETCDAVSAAATVPWVLLSAGVDFEIFERQTEIAMQAGASGWLAGRAIWKESVVMSAGNRAEFLTGRALPRITRLKEIAARHARPWTDFYNPPAPSQFWFRDYAAEAVHTEA